LGNGMPVGACWARAEVAAAFGPGDHGSTFGGQPLALAAARATLAVMEAEDVCARATRAGARLRAGLAGLPGVVSVRGAGLLLAAQLSQPLAKEVSSAALSHALLVNAVRPDAVRVAPPLLVTDDEIDAALAILADVMTGVLADATADTTAETTTAAPPEAEA
jgi:acetylornithine/N-succinyldiaminopimelate aminotransferase